MVWVVPVGNFDDPQSRVPVDQRTEGTRARPGRCEDGTTTAEPRSQRRAGSQREAVRPGLAHASALIIRSRPVDGPHNVLVGRLHTVLQADLIHARGRLGTRLGRQVMLGRTHRPCRRPACGNEQLREMKRLEPGVGPVPPRDQCPSTGTDGHGINMLVPRVVWPDS